MVASNGKKYPSLNNYLKYHSSKWYVLMFGQWLLIHFSPPLTICSVSFLLCLSDFLVISFMGAVKSS